MKSAIFTVPNVYKNSTLNLSTVSDEIQTNQKATIKTQANTLKQLQADKIAMDMELRINLAKFLTALEDINIWNDILGVSIREISAENC